MDGLEPTKSNSKSHLYSYDGYVQMWATHVSRIGLHTHYYDSLWPPSLWPCLSKTPGFFASTVVYTLTVYTMFENSKYCHFLSGYRSDFMKHGPCGHMQNARDYLTLYTTVTSQNFVMHFETFDFSTLRKCGWIQC